ncbi:MAG: hypothetical protein EXR53_03700, partial [Dehalococcoidia bacterium]|nr:hypothetical protein [Dehalococcoidia bacterium]
MTTELEVGLYILILAGFLGYHIITRVPPLLHTPLMSATNAIAGISLVGSLVMAGGDYSTTSTILGCIAVAASSTNVVGGFLITDRMLGMFRTKGDMRAQRRGLELGIGAVVALVVIIAGAVALIVWSGQQSGSEGSAPREIAGHALRYSYIVSAVLFILGLKGLSSPRYARRGMWLALFGMLLAIVGTLLHPAIITYKWIVLGLIIGSVIGGTMGLRIPMTAVPQRTALSHSLGALAACLVGIAEFLLRHNEMGNVTMTALGFQVIVGGLTFTGSLMAAGKLQELLPGRPLTYKGQNIMNLGILALVLGILIYYLTISHVYVLPFYVMIGLAFVFGLMLVIPIGAADMPVVIALLNSYGGLADAAMGFVLMNKIQIVTGSLDGTSGFLLAMLMCRAMNRSAINVLFGAFGKVQPRAATAAQD